MTPLFGERFRADAIYSDERRFDSGADGGCVGVHVYYSRQHSVALVHTHGWLNSRDLADPVSLDAWDVTPIDDAPAAVRFAIKAATKSFAEWPELLRKRKALELEPRAEASNA